MALCQRQAMLVVCCLLATLGHTVAMMCGPGSSRTVQYTSSCCNSVTLLWSKLCCKDATGKCFCVRGMSVCTKLVSTTPPPPTTTPPPPTTTPPPPTTTPPNPMTTQGSDFDVTLVYE